MLGRLGKETCTLAMFCSENAPEWGPFLYLELEGRGQIMGASAPPPVSPAFLEGERAVSLSLTLLPSLEARWLEGWGKREPQGQAVLLELLPILRSLV